MTDKFISVSFRKGLFVLVSCIAVSVVLSACDEANLNIKNNRKSVQNRYVMAFI